MLSRVVQVVYMEVSIHFMTEAYVLKLQNKNKIIFVFFIYVYRLRNLGYRDKGLYWIETSA